MKKLLAIILLLGGCYTPKVTSSWTADQKELPFNTIAVIAIVPGEDSMLRNQMERHLARDLGDLGYKAYSFHESLKPSDFPAGIRYDDARKKLVEKGIEGVMTVNLLTKEDETVFVPEQYNIPRRTDEGSFWTYFKTINEKTPGEGFYVTEMKYFWQTNLYDLDDLALLYSVNTTSFPPGDAQKLAHRFGQRIIRDMEDHRVVPQNKN